MGTGTKGNREQREALKLTMIEKFIIKFEYNDYVYEIPLEKVEQFCKSETIEDVKTAIVEAIKRL